jgi:serine phosphatase RsbU (regulator of sigma subunit)
MLLCSDGAADSRDASGVRFGEARLHRVLQQYGINSRAQQTCQSVYDCLVDYQNGAPQFDDITLLAVRRVEPVA